MSDDVRNQQGTETAQHSITVEFDQLSIAPSLRFHCHAPKSSGCRTVCPESECEEGCVRPDQHKRVPIDYCNFVVWMGNVDDAENCIVGDSTSVTVPIEIAWGGRWDGPDWRFAVTTPPGQGGPDDA